MALLVFKDVELDEKNHIYSNLFVYTLTSNGLWGLYFNEKGKGGEH